MKMSNLLVGSR